MPVQRLSETRDDEALPLWSQAVLGVGGALLLACTLFICYIRTRVGRKRGCAIPFTHMLLLVPCLGAGGGVVGSGHGRGSGGRLPTPRSPPSGKREMNNAPIWSNLETMVVPMPSDQMGTASYGVATVTRSHVKPTCELTPAVSQSNTERSQSR